MDTPSNMYAEAETWNPFKGCGYDCTYCEPSFKRQAKRRKNECMRCYHYEPHEHEDRLSTGKIPSKNIVFVCGNADLAFCKPEFTRSIINVIKKHLLKTKKKKTFYFQSKNPSYFGQFLKEFPPQVILVTTLETNRDEGYSAISTAPPPSVRYEQFRALGYPRKVVTIEPVLDFDLTTFVSWIRRIEPEYVWLGFNSKPESVELPEPSVEKVQKFIDKLAVAGIKIKGKTLRGLQVPRS